MCPGLNPIMNLRFSISVAPIHSPYISSDFSLLHRMSTEIK
jgi:hypothetical protein